MPGPPNLLDEDGSASMATALMMSHHGFRRDLARFAAALLKIVAGDGSRAEAVRAEWHSFQGTLHGHHQAEDTGMFPALRSQNPALAATIERLTADHRRIDPLLERAERAFAALPGDAGDAASVVAELGALLEPHLATEEAEVIPLIRPARSFPPPASDAEAEMYAQGFAWASHGIAPDILDLVYAMLPEAVTSRLPAARAAFEKRCERAWGSAKAGAARTPIPDQA